MRIPEYMSQKTLLLFFRATGRYPSIADGHFARSQAYNLAWFRRGQRAFAANKQKKDLSKKASILPF